jgi:FkbM family methyltransferase
MKNTSVKLADFKRDGMPAKIISYVFRVIGKAFAICADISRRMMQKLYLTPHQKVFKRWAEEAGDSIRLDYPLNKDSVVFDVGGYHGDFTSSIYDRHSCTVYVFEPVSAFYNMIESRFRGNPNIKCFPFGLGGRNEQLDIALHEDGSSLFGKSEKKKTERIKIVSITDFMEREGLLHIDLLKLNVEGSEYGILNSILDSPKPYVMGIHNIQVQFHDIDETSMSQKQNIQKKLRKTHHLTYEYEFIWENWEINEQELS